MLISLKKVRGRHMFCSECGTRNPDTNQFCRNCGKPLVKRHPSAQPVVQPAPVPVTSPPVQPAPAAPAPVQVPVAAAPPVQAPAAAMKRTRNWLGVLSLVCGILSWGILTVVLAILAVLLGIVSLVVFRKATGKIGISGIIGILLGIAAVAVLVMMT
jgi:hypothetical protein